jgi:hypothetical protein
MAVRDQQHLKVPRRSLPWREVLSQAPGVLVVAGLLVYGYLRIYLQSFYGSLGVDPNDVGLTYADTLARSVGFLLILCLVVFVPFLIALIPAYFLRGDYPTADVRRVFVVLKSLMTVAIIGFGLAVLVIGLGGPLLGAEDAARKVQAGAPLTGWALRGLIRADPTTVEPAGKRGDSPAAEGLQGKKLLYLGQSSGTVVLYDTTAQRAIYVPASSIVLHVANCSATPPPDAACQ